MLDNCDRPYRVNLDYLVGLMVPLKWLQNFRLRG